MLAWIVEWGSLETRKVEGDSVNVARWVCSPLLLARQTVDGNWSSCGTTDEMPRP